MKSELGKFLFKQNLQITAIDFQRKNIPLPDYLQKELNEMTLEEKCETEIKLIESDYKLKEIE